MKRLNLKIIVIFLFVMLASFLKTSFVLAGGDVDGGNVIKTESVTKKEVINKEPILNDALSSPTIISPKNDTVISYDTKITGAVSSGATVRVYIDGKIDGEIKSWPSKTGVSAFFYEPKQNLSEGIHFIKAQTIKNGFISDFSEEIIVIKENAYEAPIVRTPYAYKDDYKTFVVRGYANSEDKVDVYLDGNKIKTINLPKSTDGKKVSFLYAIHDLKDGIHSGYFVAYDKETGKRSYDSKTFSFEVKNPTVAAPIKTPTTTEEVKEKAEPTTKPTVIEKENTGVKVEDKKTEDKLIEKTKPTNKDNNNLEKKDTVKEGTETKTKNETTNTNTKIKDNKTSPEDAERNKSMTTGIILLICSFLLMIFWIVSENQEKLKKFIDKLLDEDYKEDENKDDNEKTL